MKLERILRRIGWCMVGMVSWGLMAWGAEAPYRVQVVRGRQVVAADTVIPAEVLVRFEAGGYFDVAEGATLKIEGALDAPMQAVFQGPGKVAFGPGRVREVCPQWWGARGDGQADDTAAIQAAIDSIDGGVVFFAPGNYANTGVTVKSSLLLKGAHRAAAALVFTPKQGSCLTLPPDCTSFRLEDLTLTSPANSSGYGIDGTNEYVRYFSLENFTVSGFKCGVYIQQGMHIALEYGYMGCYGLGEANGTVNLKLGDKPTNKGCTTTTIQDVYFTNAEVDFYNRAAPCTLVGPIFETCQIGLDTYTRAILLGPFFAGCKTAARMTDNGALFVEPYAADQEFAYAGATERARTSFLPSTFDRTMKLGPLRLTPEGELRVAGWPETATEWDPPRLEEGRSVAETFAVPGAAVSDFVLVSPGMDVQGLTISATVTAPDAVTVVLGNNTGQPVDLGSSTWKVRVWK